MRVLVGCEFSGVVRQAFRNVGHDAYSCDLLPAEDDSKFHIQNNVLSILSDNWDLAIFHPPCTYLANSGVRWLLNNPERMMKMREAAKLFNELLSADIPRIVVENAIQHKYARQLIRKPDQIIQPWQFGHGETKATCLWLKGLPLLKATNIVAGRADRVYREPPSRDRWKNRSRTFTGIAQAMSDQWGCL